MHLRQLLPPHQPWLVKHLLPAPVELADSLRITAPRDGATFVAVSQTAIIRPQANRVTDVTWFLNGRLVEANAAKRLTLPPGQYELRGIDPTGAASAVTFTVR